MGQREHPRKLSIWMNGNRMGTWSLDSSGTHYFKYEVSWLNKNGSRPISLSLPLSHADYTFRGDVVSNFFDNLLPDSSEIRKRIRERYQTSSLSPFDLLREIGRDCVGAIQLFPEGEEPLLLNEIHGREIDEHEIAQILRGVSGSIPNANIKFDEFRISLAGAQEKTALLYHQGKWKVPHGTTPSTHILKLSLGRVGTIEADLSMSIENEWLCSRLASAMGLQVANSAIAEFEGVKALVVERFDRRNVADNTYIFRVPQEDFCQVTGTSPDNKYESEGGPGIRSIMNYLQGSQNSLVDRYSFFTAQMLFWLLAAPDGHAKNFSVFIEPSGRFRLTPLYDILSAYPVLGHGRNCIAPEKLRLAMAFYGKNRHYGWSKISGRHFMETGRSCGIDPTVIIERLLTAIPRALETVAAQLPDGFPPEVQDTVFSGVERQSRILAAT